MVASYGYRDAEGDFYITIDTDRCARCESKPCIATCPRSLFQEEADPYDDMTVAVDERKRKALKYECSECKPSQGPPPLPCVTACPFDAISHSW